MPNDDTREDFAEGLPDPKRFGNAKYLRKGDQIGRAHV